VETSKRSWPYVARDTTALGTRHAVTLAEAVGLSAATGAPDQLLSSPHAANAQKPLHLRR
jgi:hypothetical protein